MKDFCEFLAEGFEKLREAEEQEAKAREAEAEAEDNQAEIIIPGREK